MTMSPRPGLAAQLTAFTLSLAVIATLSNAAQAQDLIVKYDQSSLVRLPRPAAEIIIGNPSIADVSVQNGTSLVITGKSFGVTNIITIDSQGQVIRDQRIMVRVDDERTVNVLKGTARTSLSCTPVCQPTLTIGDDEAFFKKTRDSMSNKASISKQEAVTISEKGGESSGAGGK